MVPVLILLGLLIAVVSSLGAPLVPTIAVDYGVSPGTAQWTLTITLLVGAVLTPVIGRLGDGRHRRAVLIASMTALISGCVLAALPFTIFALLVAGRGLQGVGLTLLPLAMSIARDHLEPAHARSTIATLSVTTVVGVGLGYPLTGLVAEFTDFRIAFWAAAAIGALALVAVVIVVPPSTHRGRRPFDAVGTVLLGTALALFIYALGQSGSWGWASPLALGLIAGALILLGIWVRLSLRREYPLVDLRILRHRAVLTASMAALMTGICLYLLMSTVIRFVETPTDASGLGATSLVGGLVLLPMSVASFTVTKITLALDRRIPAVRILPLGILLIAASLSVFATARGSIWLILLVMAIMGLGTGSSFAVMPRIIVSSVRPEETSSAIALNQVFRGLGFSIGSALAATILTLNTPAGQTYPIPEGYSAAAIVGIVLCVASALVAFLLPGRPTHRRSLTADEQSEIEIDAEAAVASAYTDERPETTPTSRD